MLKLPWVSRRKYEQVQRALVLVLQEITNFEIKSGQEVLLSEETLETAFWAIEPVEITPSFRARMDALLEDPKRFGDRVNRQFEKRRSR